MITRFIFGAAAASVLGAPSFAASVHILETRFEATTTITSDQLPGGELLDHDSDPWSAESYAEATLGGDEFTGLGWAWGSVESSPTGGTTMHIRGDHRHSPANGSFYGDMTIDVYAMIRFELTEAAYFSLQNWSAYVGEPGQSSSSLIGPNETFTWDGTTGFLEAGEWTLLYDDGTHSLADAIHGNMTLEVSASLDGEDEAVVVPTPAAYGGGLFLMAVLGGVRWWRGRLSAAGHVYA